MRDLALMFVVAVAAFIVPFQAIVNGRLGTEIQNPFLAALISFSGGTLALLLLVLLTSPGIPTWPAEANTPWYLFIGGFLGLIYVTTVLMITPHIGAANVIGSAVVGQLVMSMIIDHFGILGVPVIPISLTRVGGCALLLGGLYLIQMR